MRKEIIEGLLDQVKDSPTGVILVKAAPGRAIYIQNQITGYIREHAVESFQLYEPGDPLYGQGIYSRITTHLDGDSLYIAEKRDQPPTDPVILICAAAATQQPITIKTPSREAAIRYASKVINAKRSLWKAAKRAIPDVKILALFDTITISTEGKNVYIGTGGSDFIANTQPVPPEDAAAILAAIAARESFLSEALDNDVDDD